jgi:cytochrome c oxidase assembly protein subunit 15
MDRLDSYKWVRIWLLTGVVMIAIQVLLGGITRLTGSGLSITEWKPILGAVYPSSEAEWNDAFNEYKRIGQFQVLNADYQLEDFKFIFFWEWLHRNWARAIAIVFFIPFVYFVFTKKLKKEWTPQLILLFVVGMLQGLVGMVMVASGVNDTSIYVDHFKLAAHFITAMIAFVYTYWFYLKIKKPDTFIAIKAKQMFFIITVLLVLQLIFGALVAGLKAAQAVPTWPLMGETLIPSTVGKESWLSHPVNVQFLHRSLAYLLTLLILIWSWINRSHRLWIWLLIALFVQVFLGILSVLSSPEALRNQMGKFEWNALSHQFVALFLLLGIVRIWYYQAKKVISRG